MHYNFELEYNYCERCSEPLDMYENIEYGGLCTQCAQTFFKSHVENSNSGEEEKKCTGNDCSLLSSKTDRCSTRHTKMHSENRFVGPVLTYLERP